MSMKLDLLAAPHEFNNLSNDAQQRLHKSLRQWQHDTGDLMADPAALMRYTKEIDEAAAMKPFLAYRRDKNFRWRYLDWLKPKP